jgi:hypothetical protein
MEIVVLVLAMEELLALVFPALMDQPLVLMARVQV